MKKLSRQQLAQTIARLMHEGDTEHLAAEIAQYLITERRSGELNSLMRDVAKIRHQKYGIMEATATTARPITAEVKRGIAKFLESDKLILNEEQNPDLVGGLRLEALDLQLEASVHARLSTLKQRVKEA